MEARDRWFAVLPLLPHDSAQAEWIRKRTQALTEGNAKRPGKNPWGKRLAPLGPVAILLSKAKIVLPFLFKLKFLLSFAAFIGLYWAAWGMKFGIGFAVLVLIHEMGHFIDIKRRGLPADMPVFLPGLGAYVRWDALGVSQEARAAISLAGPFAGLLAAIVCSLIWWQTRDPFWAALARVGAWFNLLNLIPVWVLDGSRAFPALNLAEQGFLVAASTGLYFGTQEPLFIFVTLGMAFRLVMGLVRPKAEIATLGLSQGGPSGTGTMVGGPGISEPKQEHSPLIAAYFLAVLAGLGFILWFMPGHGDGLR